VLYSDYIGPARLRLNLPELAPELKRVWHPWFIATTSDRKQSLYFKSQSYEGNRTGRLSVWKFDRSARLKQIFLFRWWRAVFVGDYRGGELHLSHSRLKAISDIYVFHLDIL